MTMGLFDATLSELYGVVISPYTFVLIIVICTHIHMYLCVAVCRSMVQN